MASLFHLPGSTERVEAFRAVFAFKKSNTVCIKGTINIEHSERIKINTEITYAVDKIFSCCTFENSVCVGMSEQKGAEYICISECLLIYR